MDASKRMTNALLAEHGLKQAKIAAALILKAKQVIGHSNEDIYGWLDKALQTLNEEIDWYASGEALQSFQQGDPDDEGEDYDTYAPEIYAMNSIDPKLLEDTPEYQAGLKEAMQKRKAALLKASRPNESGSTHIADAVTGTPYQSREEVPEQARELWDIMHALKDDPHDNRWED